MKSRPDTTRVCMHGPTRVTLIEKGKGKSKSLDTCYGAAYMSRLKTSRALQSRKWQLIGMSKWANDTAAHYAAIHCLQTTAIKVIAPSCTSNWLALHQVGIFSNSRKALLKATCKIIPKLASINGAINRRYITACYLCTDSGRRKLMQEHVCCGIYKKY